MEKLSQRSYSESYVGYRREISAVKTMIALPFETVQKTDHEASSAAAPGNAANNRAEVLDFIETYGNFIWTLAKRFTGSNGEAEAATREIFIDIWKHAENGFKVRGIDKVMVKLIAQRRLTNYLHQSNEIGIDRKSVR